jgi:cob(I)alamin adenosyltransferase
VESNISREGILKYMDGIIDELMFKIKEHLFLLRKELDVKMGMYYNSKPVDKIRSALSGLSKSLEERFLELRHEEIEDSKFFIEVYGMKKLVNDTYSQKQNF